MKYGEYRPVKLYYSISEVSEMVGVAPHVLRYWEQEFPMLRPRKNRAGNRAYREKDIRLIRTIRTLLYEEKFTIDGARKRLREQGEWSESAENKIAVAEDAERLKRVQAARLQVLAEIQAIRAILREARCATQGGD